MYGASVRLYILISEEFLGESMGHIARGMGQHDPCLTPFGASKPEHDTFISIIAISVIHIEGPCDQRLHMESRILTFNRLRT